MKFIKIYIILSLLIIFNISCKKEEIIIQPDYQIEHLDLGIAYPSVSNDADMKKTIDALTDLGISKVHITESWVEREPTEAKYNWPPLEKKLHKLDSVNIEVLLTIESNWPSWLRSEKNHTEEKTLKAFRKYIAELLSKCGGKIDKIQYGNEWNYSINNLFDGDADAFVTYANILHEEVQELDERTRPTVVLGSFSGGARLAADQGLADVIVIEGVQVYKKAMDDYLVLPAEQKITPQVEKVLTNAQYDMLDMHVFDNFQTWDKYLQAYMNSQMKCKNVEVPLIVSEFGGPYAKDLYDVLGSPSQHLLANRLIEYIKVLDKPFVKEAYFFKLTEGGNTHQDSYLMKTNGAITPTYVNMKYFGNQKK